MRLPKSGAFFSSLYEYEISLKDVILKLDLNPLSEKDEAFVRTTIGHAIGEWSKSEGGHKEPGAKLKVADVRQSLRRLVSQLDEASKTLAAAGGGFHEAHEIEAIGKLAAALCDVAEVGSAQQASDSLTRLGASMEVAAQAARLAESRLRDMKGRHGRTRLEWHDDFARAVIHICSLNGIPSTIITDPVTRQVRGKFLEVASALQQLLHPGMRAPSPRALADRLEKSKKRTGIVRAVTRRNPSRSR